MKTDESIFTLLPFKLKLRELKHTWFCHVLSYQNIVKMLKISDTKPFTRPCAT